MAYDSPARGASHVNYRVSGMNIAEKINIIRPELTIVIQGRVRVIIHRILWYDMNRVGNPLNKSTHVTH